MKEFDQLRKKVKMPSVAFVVCLMVATIGWILINFSKYYSVTLNYKLVCSSLPEDKSTVTASDSTISLTFYSRGFEFLKTKYSTDKRVIAIPISKLIADKPKRSAYTFSNKEIKNFLIVNELFENELQEVSKPEIITFYLK